MRSRHTISYLPDSLHPDEPIRPEGAGPGPRPDFEVTFFDSTLDGSLSGASDELELLDESRPESSILHEELSSGDDPARASNRGNQSAVPASQPINPTRPQLPWGLGTDGWPRQNSRLVRLFACDPEPFVDAVLGQRWGCLSLSQDWSAGADEHVTTSGWPAVIPGLLQMPYTSRPLEVELQVQPFHERYSRVDIVLRSRHRWPRRYFDVASVCLTRMQRLERPLAFAT